MDLKDSVQERFGATAERYAASAVHAGGPDLEAILATVRELRPARVLDVGCGTGHTALALAAAGVAEVAAIDLTEEMLHQGHRLAQERGLHVDFELGDVEAMPYADGSFDLVTSRYSAHHYLHPERAIAEVARVLAPRGHLLLGDVIAPESPVADTYLQAIEVLRDPSHVRDYRVSEWLRMLGGVGFDAHVLGEWPLVQDFDAWVERMQTHPHEIEALRRLIDVAPREVHDELRFGVPEPGQFTLPTAVFRARLRS